MNKKHLALALLATLSLSVISCKGKSDAPVVNPTNPVNPTPNPGTPPSGPLQVDVNATAKSDAPVLLKSTAGTIIKINKVSYTVGSNGFIGLKEVPATLAILSNGVDEILINKGAMPWVESFSFASATTSAGKTLKVDLSSLTGLKSLVLSGYSISDLDLTSLKELTSLTLGDPNRNSDIKKVKLADDNKIARIVTRSPFSNEDLDLSKLPALEYAVFHSPRFTSMSFPNSPKLEVLGINRPTAGQAFDLTLTANPALRDLTTQDVTITNLNVEGVKAPGVFSAIRGVLSVKSLRLVGLDKEAVKELLNKLHKPALTSATLPGYGFSVGQDPLVGFTNLTTTNL